MSGAPVPVSEPVVQQDAQRDVVDPTYYRGLPGLLKLLEVVFSIVAFLPVACSWYTCSYSTHYFFKFVTMSAFISALLRWIMLLFKIRLWIRFELGFYVIVVFLYFFADVFLSIHACRPEAYASVVFGWLAIVPFSIDGFKVAQQYRDTRNGTDQPETVIIFCI